MNVFDIAFLQSLGIMGAIVASIPVVLWVLVRWRSGLLLTFVWVFLEDIVRRLIPTQPPEILFVKEGLLALTYLGFGLWWVAGHKERIWLPPSFRWAGAFIAAAVLGTLNPMSPGFLFGLVGLRSYIWYMPLTILGYYLFRDPERIRHFLHKAVYLSIPLALVALLQYLFWNSGSVLVRPFESGQAVHSFLEGPGIIQAPSVFGSAQRYASVSLLTCLLALGIYTSDRTCHRSKKRWILTVIAASVAGILMSGRRTGVLLAVLAAMWFFLPAAQSFQGASKKRRAPKVHLEILVVLSIVGVVALHFLGDLLQYFSYSGNLGEIRDRISAALFVSSRIVGSVGIWGIGTGALSQGTTYIPGGPEFQLDIVEPIWGTTPYGGTDTGIGKLLFEIGVPGLVAFYVAVFMILRDLRRIQAGGYWIIRAIYLYFASIIAWFTLVHAQILGDGTTLFFLWLSMGLAFRFARANRHYKGIRLPTVLSA